MEKTNFDKKTVEKQFNDIDSLTKDIDLAFKELEKVPEKFEIIKKNHIY